MKQIIQSFRTGRTELMEIPVPQTKPGYLLIRSTCTLVSLGTERMLVEFSKSNILQKARSQPDKVKQVLDKIKSDGLIPTLESVKNKLDEPLPLGYCNVGRVIEVGEGVSGFEVGDRVISNGPHAEYVCVPKNLCAKIPDNVSDEHAVFTVIGSIGLQGIRLCNPTFGETIVVVGMGLIGLITAQLLRANGCRVIGIDVDDNKLRLAREMNIDTINPIKSDPVKNVMQWTQDVGADGVIITASAKDNSIIAQAAQMSRKRGRVVLVGVIGLDIKRADFYEKELTFQVSCSYGPGRYDADYEQGGVDYPLPFVRWTENRNFKAILEAISTGKLEVGSLITGKQRIEDYDLIYNDISNKDSIASLLIYDEKPGTSFKRTVKVSDDSFSASSKGMALIGAGNFTKMSLLPVLQKLGVQVHTIVSSSGVSGTALAKKYKIRNSSTDYKEVLQDNDIGLVLITTRHDQHARMCVDAIKSGKSVFVEKPLALNASELDEIVQLYKSQEGNNATVTVGYNRRFSPHIERLKSAFGSGSGEGMNIVATMNAGSIPSNVWVHDLKVGGGRIIGEACHYLDLLIHLTGSPIAAVNANFLGNSFKENTDNVSVLLKFANGANGVVNYFANGSKSYSKERIEVYAHGGTGVVDNFRRTQFFGVRNGKNLSTKQDKGHAQQFKLLVQRMKQGGPALIPFDELVNSTRAAFAVIESMKTRKWIEIAQ